MKINHSLINGLNKVKYICLAISVFGLLWDVVLIILFSSLSATMSLTGNLASIAYSLAEPWGFLVYYFFNLTLAIFASINILFKTPLIIKIVSGITIAYYLFLMCSFWMNSAS